MTRLSGVEAAADRLRAQLAAADTALSDRDATIRLLNADKAYLSKEVQVSSWSPVYCVCHSVSCTCLLHQKLLTSVVICSDTHTLCAKRKLLCRAGDTMCICVCMCCGTPCCLWPAVG